jgi:hypothetical protein
MALVLLNAAVPPPLFSRLASGVRLLPQRQALRRLFRHRVASSRNDERLLKGNRATARGLRSVPRRRPMPSERHVRVTLPMIF